MLTNNGTTRQLVVAESSFTAATLKFELQPIVAVEDQSIYGYETLYRGPVKPWPKIDAALIRHLQATKAVLPRLFVNISHETLLQLGINDFLGASAAHDIIFELSETRMVEAHEALLIARINSMSRLGVKFALDDFGSGQDGLQRLFALDRIGIIKLDGTLLKTAAARPESAAMLKAVVTVWREQGTDVVAEWVETAELYAFAQSLGVNLVQGYYVDGLIAPQGIRRYLRRFKSMWESRA
jgi:EAL domain-containing protein (putative c-di-GMP-specific phosphodiesterase class I)